jgi:two-component system sensor histidine kinase TctE
LDDRPSSTPAPDAAPLPRRSLHRRLAWLLVGPLVVLSALSAVAAYLVALDAARTAYDRSLLDPALALARFVELRDGAIELSLPSTAIEALRIDSSDRVYYRVTDDRGNEIASNGVWADKPRAKDAERPVFFDTTVGGEPVRGVVLPVVTDRGTASVEVAETMVKRTALVREVLIATIVPEVIVITTAAFLLWLGIRLGLAPLERLRDEISARSPADLRPVATGSVPDEVRPVVIALNELLDRLRRALDSQKQFIGNAAHQLRTPLAGLSAHAELALRQPSSGELRRLIETLESETKRTTHLVNQLLTLARAEPAGAAIERQPVDLEEVVNQAANGWVRMAISKDVDLGFDLAHAWTYGEPLLVRELIGNLVDNAVHYTPAGGSVTVRTREASGRSVLEVEDNGPGIAPEQRSRVLERFYRVPGSTGQGCGLGLAIVKDIAERHGASVTLDAGAGGRGTLVRVAFPRLEVRAPATSGRGGQPAVL